MKKTLQELHDEIARLRGTDLRNLTDEQMRQQVHSLIHDTYGVAGTTLNNGRDWIRARPRAPVEGWRNIYDCIYPWPPVGNHGRCHSPGESRYYAAGDIDTALCEVIASPGEYVQLVLSKFSSSEHAPVMTVGQYEFFHHSQQTQFQDPNVLRTMMYFRGWAHEVKIAHLVVDAFLAEQFAYPTESRYRLTAAFTELWPTSNGVAYPSVKTRGGINLAVNRAIFDRHVGADRKLSQFCR